MTVGELRAAMEGVPDDMKVTVYDEGLRCAQLARTAEIASLRTYRKMYLDEESDLKFHFLISSEDISATTMEEQQSDD
jgi:hypothetical protein